MSRSKVYAEILVCTRRHQYVFFMTLIFEYVSNYEKTVTTTNLPMIFLEVFLKKEEDFFDLFYHMGHVTFQKIQRLFQALDVFLLAKTVF